MTAVKTVEYCFPVLSSLTDNTLTALTQITVYLPEDSKTFISATISVWAMDIATATSNSISSRRVDCSVNGAGATSVTNNNTVTSSAENIAIEIVCDFTAQFTSNWGTATSRTVDCSVLIDQSGGTTLGWVDVCAKLSITYEYDETSATHVKTVMIPLNAPVGALATSKPGSPTSTIPALDTYCPEASKTYRQINIIVKGNDQRTSATDATFSIEIDSAGAQTTGNNEGALSSSRYFVRTFPGQSWDTSTTHDFYIWASLAQWNHLQVWFEVTYEFDPSSTTSILNSVWLPARTGIRMGGTTSSDYVSAVQDLWIEEPGTIANGRIAAYLFWTQADPIAGLNARLGTGSFVTYTDSGSLYAGGSGLMIRNDSAFTLARGRNTLTLDIYRTDATDLGWFLSGLFMVSYTSDKPSAGVHVANKSVRFQSLVTGTAAAALVASYAMSPPDLNSALHFISGAWLHGSAFCNTSTRSWHAYWPDTASRDTNGLKPHDSMALVADTEVGTCPFIMQLNPRQWPTSPIGVDPESATASAGLTVIASASNVYGWAYSLWLTYHGITFDIAGNVTDSASGTVTLIAHRQADGIVTTSRSGDGAYTMTWYDDTEDVYVVGQEDATHVGASAPDTAA